MSALSERIAKANRHGWNGREVERRAKDAGESVSHGTAYDVLAGKHGNVKDSTLRAFAKVFRIPVAELRQLAGLPAVNEAWTPPAASSRLSAKQRRLVESLIHELARPDLSQSVRPPEDVDAEDLTLPAVESRPS